MSEPAHELEVRQLAVIERERAEAVLARDLSLLRRYRMATGLRQLAPHS